MGNEEFAVVPPAGIDMSDSFDRMQRVKAARERASKARNGKPLLWRWRRKPPIVSDDEIRSERLGSLLNRRQPSE